MKKILSIMLVATVIVLGGYFYIETNLPTGQDKLTQIKISQTQSNAAETSDEEETSVAVEYLDKFKGPYKCSSNIAINENLKTETRLFVAKGLVREIFTQIVKEDGKVDTITTNLIFRGDGHTYTWIPPLPQGSKKSVGGNISTISPYISGITGALIPDNDTCEPWTLDPKMFILPTGVKFIVTDDGNVD